MSLQLFSFPFSHRHWCCRNISWPSNQRWV